MAGEPLLGAIEAGGTKFVLGVARGVEQLLESARIPTTTPAETLDAAFAFFDAAAARHGRFAAIGIASFGPLVLDRAAPDWGRIGNTTKPGWTGTDVAGAFTRRYGCPAGFDTDVNGAVLAEGRWGAARGVGVASYVTVGTGIGGGLLVHGRTVQGRGHPEMGHIVPRRHADDPDFPGHCSFHGACLEGLASGPAIAARYGATLSDLPGDHPGHGVIAYYLAQLVIAQQALFAPERIILGGGVMATPGLIARVRAEAVALGQGYFALDAAGAEALILPPALGDRAGLMGALALAEEALP